VSSTFVNAFLASLLLDSTIDPSISKSIIEGSVSLLNEILSTTNFLFSSSGYVGVMCANTLSSGLSSFHYDEISGSWLTHS
jgi:hypothetical protein